MKALKEYKIFRRDRKQANRLSGEVVVIVQSGIAAGEIKLKTIFVAVVATLLIYITITVCFVYLEPLLKVTLHVSENLLQQLSGPPSCSWRY